MQSLSHENKCDVHENELVTCKWFRTKTRFDPEAKATWKWPIITGASLQGRLEKVKVLNKLPHR